MKQGRSAKASLEHLVFYPSTTATKCPTIVALHGRGTNEHDLLPLVEALALNEVLVVAPRAPLPLDPGGSMGGFAWYRIDQEGLANQETFQQSVELLSHFLEEIKAGYPVNPGRLVLLGFSQGTVMAYALALLYPGSVRGIAALSGYVPHKSGLPLRLRQLDGFQVFISHGAHDEVIPVGFARESAELLRSAGADVVYHEYAMGHEVREATLRDLSVWMRKLLFLGPDGPIRSNT